MQYTCNIGLNTGQHICMGSVVHLQFCVVYETNGFDTPVVIGNMGIVGCDGVSGEWFCHFKGP